MVAINPFSKKYARYLKIDLSKIDPRMIRLAIARSSEQNNEKYLDMGEEEDIISLFLLFQSLSKAPHAPEVLSALTAYEKLMSARISKYYGPDVLEEINDLVWAVEVSELAKIENPMKRMIHIEDLDINFPKEDLYRLRDSKGGMIEYALKWEDAYDVIDIKEQYIIGSYLFLTRGEMYEVYSRIVKKKCFDYIKRISPRMQEISHPVYEKILERVKALLKVTRTIERVSGDLSEELFPPCVQLALHGVSSGQRNYAITILLTSFLSYARLMPSTRIFDRESSFNLNQEDIEILLNDVVPAIIEAGDSCEPPFFKEQPIEKMNIFYHLGFGMTETPAVQDFGKSKWYLPPSCTKVAENVPNVCQPDDFCKLVTWGIKDRETVSELVSKARKSGRMAQGERILEILMRGPRHLDDISKELDLGRKELSELMATMSKNKLIGRKKISNPLIYYIRKKRMINRK